MTTLNRTRARLGRRISAKMELERPYEPPVPPKKKNHRYGYEPEPYIGSGRKGYRVDKN